MSIEQLDQLVQRVVTQAGLEKAASLPPAAFVPALTSLVAGISYRLGNART
jgi:hypothetical protein